MSLTDYLIYQKNKLVAGGDTQKEMELNRKEMELKEQRAMEKQVKEEQKRLIDLERERARQEYSVKEAREIERIKYERKIKQAQQSGGKSILDNLLGGSPKTQQPAPRKRVMYKKKPPKKFDGFGAGKGFKWTV